MENLTIAKSFYLEASKNASEKFIWSDAPVFSVADAIISTTLVVSGERQAAYLDIDVKSNNLDEFLNWLVYSKERNEKYPHITCFTEVQYIGSRPYWMVVNTNLISFNEAKLLASTTQGMGILLGFECPMTEYHFNKLIFMEDHFNIKRIWFEMFVSHKNKKAQIYIQLCDPRQLHLQTKFIEKAKRWNDLISSIDSNLKIEYRVRNTRI